MAKALITWLSKGLSTLLITVRGLALKYLASSYKMLCCPPSGPGTWAIHLPLEEGLGGSPAAKHVWMHPKV